MAALMDQVMAMANRTDSGVDPLVLGALVSFGLVFAHPFMDGNGRLSRFLFHKVVCGHGLWRVTAVDDVRVDAVFKGDPDIYRFWDATDCVAFGLQMASEAGPRLAG